MVLLPLQSAPDGWEALRGAASPVECAALNLSDSTAATAGGPVLIFVAARDVDAIAAVKVLTALLKADLTRYEVHPVHGYQHLATKFRDLESGVQPRSCLLVNCGAMVDLEYILANGEQLKGDIRVFVMDCHRPFHLKNIRSERVVLFDDLNEVNYDALPLDVDWEDEWGNVDDEDSSDDESDSDSDSDTDNDDDGHQNVSDGIDDDNTTASPRRKRRRRSESHRQSDIEEDDVVFDDEVPASDRPRPSQGGDHDDSDHDSKSTFQKGSDQPNTSPRHRRRKTRNRTKASRRRVQYDDAEIVERERLRQYYSSATIAMSSACLSHSVAAVMRRSNLDTLWMAIVGVTSQYITSMISHELYQDSLGYFEEQIKTITPDHDLQVEGTSRVRHVGYAPSCSGYQLNRIAPNVELRLDLLRHWSLYDSLLYSTYTATRLSAWRQTGRRRMLELLATLGIPLKESKQQWCYMKEKCKIALEKHFEMAVRRFDLGENVRYDSFVRSLPGHRGDISAADFAHGISSLLEFDEPSRRDPSRGKRSLEERFWTAYDALDPRKTVLLERGLDMAISIQKLTADVGGDVIERRKFVPSGPFRYVFLRDHQCKEFLAHPLLLRRLALFIIKSLLRQGVRDKPFIVLALDNDSAEWLVVAAASSSHRNDFGHRFRRAAERNGSEVVYDGFDSAVCRVKDGQEIEFVRFLHDIMR